MSKFVIGEFNNIGINHIDVDLVISSWNHLWLLSEWKGTTDEWLLVKYVRKDSQVQSFKTKISTKQANILIEKLGLIKQKGFFTSGRTYRREIDIEFLDNYRRSKLEQQ